MLQYNTLQKPVTFEELSKQEQESVFGGLKYPKIDVFLQITNIFASAKSEKKLSNENVDFSSNSESIYQFSQYTFGISQSFDED